jgi:predicted nuclease of restriction endonuclease-like (RecB) superfamily
MNPNPIAASPSDYTAWLSSLKASISAARSRAALAVNSELIALYFQIGQDLLAQQTQSHWGGKVVARLAADLKAAFPDMKGFSERNLKYMRYFAEHCPNAAIGQQPAAQLPWFHIVTLLTKVADPAQREWYAQQAAAQGWSRLTLELHIQNQLIARQGKAVTNFALRLPDARAALAQETLKDPYIFDFLGVGDEAHERDIEAALVRHITQLLLELGTGFAFLGRQVRVEVAGDEFFIDLLFYHTRLKCHVVVELKSTAFKPEHIGQLNFYLAVVDAQIKAPDDQPTIGILLCKKKNRLVAQYAVNGIDTPIGIAEYHLLKALPNDLGKNLPDIAMLEAQLAGEWLDGLDGRRDE